MANDCKDARSTTPWTEVEEPSLALQRSDEAPASYAQAIEIKPDYAEAHFNQGMTLQALKRLEDAVPSYHRAIQSKPNYAEAYAVLGHTLSQLMRFDEALASYAKAIKVKPDCVEAYSSRGVTLTCLGRLDEALESYGQAIRIRPDYAEVYSNRGQVLQELNRSEEAIENFEQAIKAKPDFAIAHWNLSLCRLLMGDFARGWETYEWRWETEDLRHAKRSFAQPRWLGKESLQGKTILLRYEQGFGDTLQFCRYATLVNELGADVILEVPQPLFPVMNALDGVAQLIATDSLRPEFDYECPLGSLPLAFKTELNTIPSPQSYIASAPDKVAIWKARLGKQDKPRIGLVWQGSTTHGNDHNLSIALSDILQTLLPNLHYVSLQAYFGAADRLTLNSCAGIAHFSELLRDFGDTAALIELMDVVVTVDTSVAHLAGAMGKPTWVLLPFRPDWRWQLEREDSPWYPSVRLFKQQNRGNWEPVLQCVFKVLARHFRH